MPEQQRPWEYSAFRVTVGAVRALTPGFRRITLTGPDLRHFAPWGVDQRIKLVLPRPDGSIAEFGLLDEPTPHPSHWYTRWRELPDTERNVLRTYTPAGIRPEQHEIDVDFFIHEPAGPASAWALAARTGDPLVITGPDVRNGDTGYGIHWKPGDATRFLLIGDETAYPAIRNIHASLPEGTNVEILVEATNPLDALVPSAQVVPAGDVPGERLEHAVRAWGDARPGHENLYVWIAGESGMVTRTRRYLTAELHIPKPQVAFLGYWKLGGPLTA
ncbi:siderophore-interacting protein [Nocardia sp. NPDC058176]|uniref:siderophore-interacting protein n=1 Tax=Nocardia sp. NPDC058176 TaxID=3346368 RepID=UPI0036DF1813